MGFSICGRNPASDAGKGFSPMVTAPAPGMSDRRSLCAALIRISYVCSLSSCEDLAASASSDEATIISAGSQEDDRLRRLQKVNETSYRIGKAVDHRATTPRRHQLLILTARKR